MNRLTVGSRLTTLASRARDFLRSKRGNVAMMFGLAMVPLTIAAGTGLDYSRAMLVRQQMNEALDAAALAIGATPGLSQSSAQTLANSYFSANYQVDKTSFGTPSTPTVTYNSNGSVSISVTDNMPTVLMRLAGFNSLPITANSTVVWGQTKLWVSLVLDNTGSMCEPDSNPCPGDTNPNIKINALKTASHQLLTILQNAAANNGDVQVAIVPFVKDVNVGTANSGASWVDFTSWNAANGSNQCSGYTWNGNGWTRQCTWVPASHSTWNGCVTDRNQNYDVQDTTPTSTSTDFPAEQYSPCPEAMMGLTYNWTNLSAEIDGMSAGGGTDQPIGLVWGWQALTQGAPMSPPSLPANTSRYIIILSDGLNTQDRWYGDGVNQSTQVDAREAQVCTNAKADGVIIYAVYVDLNGTQGNSTALQSCATDSSKYYDLTTSGAIVTAFNQIAQQITNVRVSH